MKIFINGRFLAAPDTGVQRVANQLVTHLDASLSERAGDLEWILVRPSGSAEISLTRIKSVALAGAPGPLWEQLTLANAARRGILLNLANSAPLLGRKSVVMIHDAQVFDAPDSYSPAFRLWYRFMLPRVCRQALSVLTVSRQSAERLAARKVIASADRAGILANGVDHILAIDPAPNIVAARGLFERPFLLGFASDQPHKNIRLLIQIARSPELSGFDFALIGSRLPAGAEPPANVKLLGRVSDAELRALYQSCFAFLMPSTTEGFGLPVGEAMLCGAPVIVSDGGALAEVWTGAAIFASPSQPDAWVKAIKSLTSAGERQQRMDAGRRYAGQFTWSASAQRLRAIIEQLSARLS